MTALTAARNTVRETVDTLRTPMAGGAEIFPGGLVCVNAAGYAVAAADEADYKCVGVAADDPQNPGIASYDNTLGDDGDMEVVVLRNGRFRFHLAERTPQQNMMCAKVYVYDDQTVAVCREDVTHDVRCGHITALPGTTLAMDAHADFDTDEVEIEFSGDPFDWLLGTTTVAPTTTTTTAQA